MMSSPFTLRSTDDLLATFRASDQKSVIPPPQISYPLAVPHYFAWTESSGVYTYLVYKRADWEVPLGLVFQRNGQGNSHSPAGMCDWCHHAGPSDEVGLLTTQINAQSSGGTWLCLDLNCLERIQQKTGAAAKNTPKLIQKLGQRIGEFYQRVRIDP
jgi:hypothetical protein